MDMKKYGGFIPLIVAMLLIFSYSVPAIRDGVGSFLDTVLGPLANMVPFYVLIVILSTATALYSSIIQKLSLIHI